MKARMISIRPQHACNIFNLIKLWEIRTQIPSDYVGWYYIYVTKGKPLVKCSNGKWYVKDKDFEYDMTFSYYGGFNGKVVARFWCDKVEEIKINFAMRFFTKSMNEEELLKQSCLTLSKLEDYLLPNLCCGYAIHITKLEIFDKPRELVSFVKNGCMEKAKHYIETCPLGKLFQKEIPEDFKQYILTKAPQSWCYVEV